MSTVTRLHHRSDDDPRGGFESHRDFLASVLAARRASHQGDVTDMRLRSLTVRDAAGPLAFMLPVAFTPPTIRAAAGSDEQGTYADPYGGFAVRSPAVSSFALSAVESDPTAERTLRIPMPSPTLNVLARTDKNHTTSVSGGLVVVRTPEAAPRASSRMEMELVSLHASSLFGLAFATEELLGRNAGAFIAILDAAFRDEFGDHILREKIRGTGAGEYLGVLNAPCKITVAKETSQAAATIVAENVVKMAARCWRYNQGGVWLANPNARPTLAQAAYFIEGESGGGVIPVFQPATREGEPDFLHGRPCFFTEHCETLGTEGDLLLVNWSEYLEGIYQPLEGAQSVHVRFEEHERAFKFWTRNDGAPWWRAPLTPENGTDTLSPVVTLAARS